MGGHALKSVETRRCSREEFDELANELVSILKNYFKDVAIPLFFRNKDSFGDIDIICSVDSSFNMDMRDFITQMFSPGEIFHNANCWSFDYKQIQIDLLTTSPEHFDSNCMYLSYNDLGNFIGRLAQCFGMKYGQEGLWYKHKFKGQYIDEIPVSKDYYKIFDFLDLDYNRYLEGFNDLEDIFQFVYKSKYFVGARYQLDQLNKINRDRNLKRKSYMSFLDWIEKQPVKEYEFKTIEEYHDIINEAFPEASLIENIRRIEYKYCKSLYIKSKFNGGDIMKRFGIEGKALGELIPKFKDFITYRYSEIYPKNTFEEFILDSDKDVIFDEFEFFLD
jgi:hypothetical protein